MDRDGLRRRRRPARQRAGAGIAPPDLRGAGDRGRGGAHGALRLVADELIERRRVGRNSFYRLAPRTAGEFARATERIYFAAPQRWSGAWRLVVLPSDGEDRSATRCAGRHGDLAPGILITPLGSDGRLYSGRDPAPSRAVALDARGAGRRAEARGARLEPRRPGRGYREFLDAFAPLEWRWGTARR